MTNNLRLMAETMLKRTPFSDWELGTEVILVVFSGTFLMVEMNFNF